MHWCVIANFKNRIYYKHDDKRQDVTMSTCDHKVMYTKILQVQFNQWKKCMAIPYGCFQNNGTPKSSILVGFFMINHPFWGTPIFGNIHIMSFQCHFFQQSFLSMSRTGGLGCKSRCRFHGRHLWRGFRCELLIGCAFRLVGAYRACYTLED